MPIMRIDFHQKQVRCALINEVTIILVFVLVVHHPGNYFGTHFIMGGERFDTPQPESYLFGENADLNFLGTKPTLVRDIGTFNVIDRVCILFLLN